MTKEIQSVIVGTIEHSKEECFASGGFVGADVGAWMVLFVFFGEGRGIVVFMGVMDDVVFWYESSVSCILRCTICRIEGCG